MTSTSSSSHLGLVAASIESVRYIGIIVQAASSVYARKLGWDLLARHQDTYRLVINFTGIVTLALRPAILDYVTLIYQCVAEDPLCLVWRMGLAFTYSFATEADWRVPDTPVPTMQLDGQ